MAALILSDRATRGRRLRLMRIYLALLLLNVLGAAILGLGLILTVPLTILAGAQIYLPVREAGAVGAESSLPLP